MSPIDTINRVINMVSLVILLFCPLPEASPDDLCRDAAESSDAAEAAVVIVC